MRFTINHLLRVSFSLLISFYSIHFTYADMTRLKLSPSTVNEFVRKITKGENAQSLTSMIDDTVMKKHLLSDHAPDQPYFYTNNRLIISDIVTMVLEHPDGIINEIETTGLLKLYRDFNFSRDVRALFLKEKRLKSSFEAGFLGETAEGPTNQVIVLLKVKIYKGSPHNIEELLAYPENKTIFMDAYPGKLN